MSDERYSEILLLKPTSDVFIAALLSAPKNEPILRGLINAVLLDSGGAPIRFAQVMNPFSINEFAEDKRIILDVRVEDEQGQKYNIEVQTASHAAFHERILYGWAKSYSSQIFAGDDYVELRSVISIVIAEFNVFPETEDVHLVFEAKERKNHKLLFSNQLQIHFLRLFDLLRGRLDLLDNIDAKLKHWLLFLAFGREKGEDEMSKLVENDPVVMEAQNELVRFSSDPKVQDYLRRRKLAELDYHTRINDAHRTGLAAGIAEGIEKGIAEGISRGMAEGKAEGKADAIVKILARRLGTIPKGLESKLHSITDIEKLERLLDLALDAASMAEFENGV